MIQECSICHHKQWYPRTACEECGKRDLTWLKCSGKGVIHSFTIIKEVVMNSPAFEKEIPYALAILDLDEGVRMVAQVMDLPLDKIQIGLKVEAYFEPINGVSIAKFRPLSK